MSGSASGGVSAHTLRPQISCSVCGVRITSARLKANPDARQCVACLSAAGDVQPIQRYDEFNHETSYQTYFTRNPQLELARDRSLTVVPSEAAYFVAMGDDADYVKPPRSFDTGTIPDDDFTEVTLLQTEDLIREEEQWLTT